MKNESIRTVFAMLVFGSVLFSLACSGSGTVSENRNTGVALGADPCRGSLTYAQKVTELTDDINAQISKKTKLKKQKDDGKFGFSFQPVNPGELIQITVTGRLYGVDGDKESTMENFFDTFDDHLRPGCIEKVTIEVSRTSAGEQRQRGDLWSLCEYPDEVCPNGECKYQGTCPMAVNVNTANNANANTMPNSNSSSNSNSGKGNN